MPNLSVHLISHDFIECNTYWYLISSAMCYLYDIITPGEIILILIIYKWDF